MESVKQESHIYKNKKLNEMIQQAGFERQMEFFRIKGFDQFFKPMEIFQTLLIFEGDEQRALEQLEKKRGNIKKIIALSPLRQ